MQLTHLSDDEIFSHLEAVRLEGHRVLARLLALLVEVEERRLHTRSAFPSMFEFCTRRLGMSDAAAFRRTTAARLVRRFPALLEHIERGDVSLSTLVLLRDYLTAENLEATLAEVRGKSTRDVEELLARRAPRPDVPATLRKLPTQAVLPTSEVPSPASQPPPRTARIEPLAEERYKLELTVSRDMRDKLERARDLMMHANPNGTLAVVVERALDVLLEKLEKQRLGKAERPRERKGETNPGRVSRAVRREVFEREGAQCTYVSADGARCPARALLELDHVVPRAHGGGDEATNLRVRCRAHNQLYAEEVFGKEHVKGRIDFRRRKWDDETEMARRGLVHLGFRIRDATRALGVVAERHKSDATPPPKETVLREALAVLA